MVMVRVVETVVVAVMVKTVGGPECRGGGDGGGEVCSCRGVVMSWGWWWW